MSKQFNEQNILRNKGRFAGVVLKEPEGGSQTLTAMPGGKWNAHADAIEAAAEATGIASGDDYTYSSAVIMLGREGAPEGFVNLVDETGGRNVQLRHNYHSNVTSYIDIDGSINTTDHGEVNKVVNDIAPAWRNDPAGMFTRLGQHSARHEGIEDKARNALLAVPSPWDQHSEATKAAVTDAGMGDGDEYNFASAALMTNPAGEPEAYLNLRDDAGATVQVMHNYSTGKSAILHHGSPGRKKSRSSDPEVVASVVSDISGGQETQALFGRFRKSVLEQPKLHSKLRNQLAA